MKRDRTSNFQFLTPMNQQLATEQNWITQARRGDLDAFNQLVRAYQSLLYNTAYRILGDPDRAADATQEALISAYRAITQYRGGSFKGWLMRIVTNACYDQLRVKQRNPATSLDEMTENSDNEHLTYLADGAESPEDHALRAELSRGIQRGINTLPADQRVALVLRDVQGFSYEEIAQITAASLGTVKSRINRGRAKLRDHLLTQKELLPASYRLKDRASG